jgi:hypothetical protein
MSSHTAVLEIELNDGGSISLTVIVFGFQAKTLVEISGHLTQANGAVATFYDVQKLPPPAKPGDGSVLKVIADPPAIADSSVDFVPDHVITVVGQTRAVKVWGTVLHRDPDDKRPGTKAIWKARLEGQSHP